MSDIDRINRRLGNEVLRLAAHVSRKRLIQWAGRIQHFILEA